ncbi:MULTISPECIES: hypothetical protein [Methylobacterium]|uniref:hypothetical protein n=1 Tax=Methylobacterium TaxID=407 RepID=UPI0013EBE81C|nr:hypothetical protein [Methylobacterium sp. DB0501]NGM36814.1 hypothetical protein [Methylobacterium sp. DB0501]
MAEEVIIAVSIFSIAIPLTLLAREMWRNLFPSRLFIKDRNGRVVREITPEAILRANPTELKRFHEIVKRRIRDDKAA